MKKIINILLCMLFALTSCTNSHMEFMGIPIDGEVENFVMKMKQKGFKYKSEGGSPAIVEGKFAGYDCAVGIMASKQVVSDIFVVFPNEDSWNLLSSNYYNIKDMLTQKYGTPSNCIEEFQGYTPDDDKSKMNAVEYNRCNYITTYETGKGDIELSIKTMKGIYFNKYFVLLHYRDKINSAKGIGTDIDDL